MINKLQFLHKSELFETREKAIEFLNNLRITRPSLFAEPVVLRYGNEKEPNVILAIGATGSGSTQATLDSSYFMIDAQGIKDDVQEKYDEIEHALAKFAFAIVDTNTLDLEKVETEDSITLKGNVKVPEKVAINDSNITNIIKTNKDGLYSYVNLKFDDKTNTFTFQVNENVNTFSIPVIESGKYDISKEAIVFTFTDGKTTEVDVDDLIDEWTTEGENSETPIVLTKERHTDKNTDIDDRNSDQWKDVLKADVRIASDKEHNILEKTTDGRNLYVKGTADNIFFKDGKNVKEAIEGIKTEVSSAYTNNIIFKDYTKNNGEYNGIAANVDVVYKKETNTLVFKHSNNNGDIVSKEFKLNSAAFVDDISYDTVNEKITIRYKDEDGIVQTTDIELSSLLDDWVINSDGHNVELNKQVKPGDKDVLTADVKLTDKTNDNYQILEERDDKLYVRGTADNIVYDTEKGETVKSAFERTENELQTESDRAVSAEKSLSASVDTINSTIGSGFTALKTETITDKFTSLSGKVDNEISERKESDKNFTKSIETLTESAKTANTNITNLYNGLGDDYIGNNDSHTAENTVTNRLHRLEVSATTADANIKELSNKTVDLTSSAETANTKISELTNSASTLFEKADALDDKIDTVSGSAHFEVGDTDTVAMSKNVDVTSHTVTANVKVSSKDKNTILVDGNNGLYASLDYDADRNVIIISDTNSDTHKKEIQLNSVSVIEYMRYDKAREVIVIGYKSNASSSETNTLEIPITDVLGEWETNNNSHSVRLVRTQHAVDGTDELSGDVVLATEGKYSDNLIKQVTTTVYDEEMKGLYVSGDKINESARGIAKEEAKAAADKALVDAKSYTDSVHETVKSEINTAKVNGVSEASAYTDNKVSGVDTKAQTYASNAETNSKNYADGLRQSSKDEISQAKTNLQQMIATETSDRTAADDLINSNLANETSARQTADTTLQGNIDKEISDRTTAYGTLQTNINNEVSERAKADDTLQKNIDTERTTRETNDNTLDSKITKEIELRTQSDTALSKEISTTADKVKGYADTKASEALGTAKEYTNTKNDSLSAAIKTYVDNEVGDITLVGDTTNTATVSVTNKKIAAGVRIASGDRNRIVANADGLYVGDITASYNSQTNTLTINGLNGQPVLTQKLNSASFIDSINYDEATHYLIITYHTTEESSATTVNVNLTDLIKDTKADETSNTPIEITVSATSENGVSVNKIKGDVNIANNVAGNILKTVDQSGKGALYADASGILSDINALNATTKSLSDKTDDHKEEINKIETSVGLSGEGNFVPYDKPYISSATSLADADKKLAEAVASVDKSISNLTQGSKTYSVNVFTEKDDNSDASLLKADVRLSVANGQDESELTRTEMPNGNNYEGNLLQIVKAKSNNLAIELGEKINGLYFGGSIDYGMMEGDDSING